MAQCTSTSIDSRPHKLSVSAPMDLKRWIQLVWRDTKSIMVNSNVFIGEDHFDVIEICILMLLLTIVDIYIH